MDLFFPKVLRHYTLKEKKKSLARNKVYVYSLAVRHFWAQYPHTHRLFNNIYVEPTWGLSW